SGIVDIEPKPPILWTHGTADIVVADGSAWEMGTLGKLGYVPGWPGEDVFPPQPMVTQIRNVLQQYRKKGGRVEMEMFEGSGHGPESSRSPPTPPTQRTLCRRPARRAISASRPGCAYSRPRPSFQGCLCASPIRRCTERRPTS